MANRRRGEIEAVVDGEAVTLCLTLGALCELEAAFGAEDLVALAERFGGGRLSARDLLCIFACGLRGGGRTVSDTEVAAMRVDGGLAGLAGAVADLLEITFGDAGGADAKPSGEARGATSPEVGADARPPVVPGAAASPSLGTP